MENTFKYKGYFTNINFSVSDRVLYGKIEGIDDLVTFESDNAADIEKEFHNAVDDYLAFCEEVGKEPSKTYKGTFNVRINPELHRSIALNATKNGISLNQAVEKAINQYILHEDGHIEKTYMESIVHDLSEIKGAIGQINTSYQTTQTIPLDLYGITVTPENIGWEIGGD